MKLIKEFKYKSMVLVVLLGFLFFIDIFSQPLPPPPAPPVGGGTGGPGVPIDGSLFLLISSGISYGLFKFRKIKNFVMNLK